MIETSILMCHAPIVIPAIGGRRGAACRATTAAMTELGALVAQRAPDLLVVLSPHTPRLREAWGVVQGGRVEGDLGRFGAPGVRIDLPSPPQTASRVAQLATARGAPARCVAPSELDHGASVPLHFACAAGWAGPTLLIAVPWQAADTHDALGRALAEASGDERWLVLASGDMSHRLQHGAPSGFHPRAVAFDTAFVAHLRAGDARAAVAPDPDLRALAAEDVIDTTAVAAASVGWDTAGTRVLAYEGPFGVGYCEAVLCDRSAA